MRTDDYSLNFTKLCMVCGATVTYADGQEQPHRCRIDLDAKR